MSDDAPDELEHVDIAFYKAVRAGLIVREGINADGDATYSVTEIGKVRARVLAIHAGIDPDTLGEHDEVALCCELHLRDGESTDTAL